MFFHSITIVSFIQITRITELFPPKAKPRDIGCAITKQSSKNCHATRILPLALCQQYSFGEVLEMFWGKKRKDRIFNLVSNIPRYKSSPSEISINSTCNPILLSDPQTCWIRGDFILEPVDHDDIFNSCELDARVRWVLRNSFQPWSTRTNADPTNFEPSKNNRENKLYNHDADLPMKDDDVITSKTDHPISMPLPDRDLLELHRFMMQVLRLAGRVPWDYNRKNCASSVIDGRMAEQDRDLGYTLEAEGEFDAGASVYPGPGSSFPLNPSAGSLHLRKWQVVSTTRGIWFRMRWFLRTRILRSKGKALRTRAAGG